MALDWKTPILWASFFQADQKLRISPISKKCIDKGSGRGALGKNH